MKLKHILFQSLPDLLRFLISRLAQGRRSQAWHAVTVAKSGYAVTYDSSDWDGAGDRFGGKIFDGRAEGQVIEVNTLLEMILLQRVPSNYNAGAQSLVLALPVEGQVAAATAQDILYDAWGKVERTESARSAFYTCKTKTERGWHAVRIDGVSPSFDFEKFHQANFAKFETEGLRLLAPAWDAGGCFLFVEWEYRYPKPEEFAQLFRDLSGELILCLAERPAPVEGIAKSWWVPEWHILEGGVYFTTADLFEVAVSDLAKSVRYPGGEGFNLNKLVRPLEIGPVSETVASARDLEVRIGSLERELEALNSKRDRLARMAHQEIFAIYAWEQPAEQPLPAGLEKLLVKPLGELSRYLYLSLQSETGSTTHFVACKEHQLAAGAVSVVCDRLYLCDARWQRWKLPLYVRHGTALKIDINEEEMAALVSNVLPAPEAMDGDLECLFCLVEPSNPEDKIPQFLWLPFSRGLDAAVALTNDGAAGPDRALRSARHDANHAAISNDIAISDSSNRLDTMIRRRAEEKLRVSEETWEKVRRDLQAASFQTRIAEIAMRPLSDAHLQMAENWNRFVERTLAADAIAAHFKLAQLGVWTGQDPARRTLLSQHEQGLVDVEAIIKQRTDEYEALFTRIEERNKLLAEACAGLDQKLIKLREEQTKMSNKVTELGAANARLQQQIDSVTQSAKTIEDEATRCAQLQRDLSAIELREQQAEHSLRTNAADLEESLSAFRRRLQKAHELERQIKSALPMFRRIMITVFGNRGSKS